MTRAWAVCACVLLPTLASAQSLGEIAAKERERRKKAQETGAAAPVINEDALKANKGALANDPKATSAPSPSPKAGVAPAPKVEPPKSVIPEIPREKAVAPPTTEAEWRERAQQARYLVDQWQQRYDYWSNLSLAPGEYFTDDDGRKVVGSPEMLQQIIARAKANLDAAKQAQQEFEHQARLQNVPPGWLR